MSKPKMDEPSAWLRMGFEPWNMSGGVVETVRLPYPDYKSPPNEKKSDPGGGPVELKVDPRMTRVLIDFLHREDNPEIREVRPAARWRQGDQAVEDAINAAE